MNPKKRTTALLVQEAGDELVVYDQQRQLAHRLNHTASIVFQHADGHTSLDELATILQHDLGVTDTHSLIELALDQLAEANLLEHRTPRISKRALAVGAGIALLLPVVETLLAPPAEAAATFTF